jgi:hypothetical protein
MFPATFMGKINVMYHRHVLWIDGLLKLEFSFVLRTYGLFFLSFACYLERGEM